MNDKSLRVLEYNKIIETLSEYAVNDIARERILAIKPVSDFDTVNSMQNETDEALVCVLKYGSPDIARVKEVSPALKRIDVGGALSAAELLNIAKVLKTARVLKKYIISDDGTLSSYFNMLTPDKTVETQITTAILSEEEIADNASVELASIRRKMKSAEAKIRSSLNSLTQSAKYQKYLQDAIVTMRNNRYVVPVKAEYRNEITGIVHDVSSSGSTLFVEPQQVVNANNEIHELSVKEQVEIERILFELSSYVGEISDLVSANFENIINIDFIFAKAKLARAMDAVRPNLNNDGKLDIKQGRHPLLDKAKVVPINVYLGDEFDTLVVTGPNTGGKTVVLKTVGLFCLMNQSGLHIPAHDSSVMCVFDNIFADIGDEQSIEQSLSTFSSHMKNIVDIVENVTPNSLVLFDELGAGTDPTEGAALATAILDYIKNFGAKTVATTHYSELKMFAITTPRVENASCEFNVETLSPTYRLLIGVPGKSNAFSISHKLGLSDHIIANAKELLTTDNVKFEDVLQNIEQNRQTSETERAEAEALRAEIERLKQSHQNEVEKLEKEKERILERAKAEAAEIIEDAKEETNELIKQLRDAQEAQDKAEIKRAMEEVKRELNLKHKRVAAKSSSPPKKRKSNIDVNTLKPGTSVLIIDLEQKGNVLSVNKREKTAVIQVGIMKVTAKVDNLEIIEEQVEHTYTPEARRPGLQGVNAPRGRAVNELDLRGYSLDEALLECDRFLDESMMSGLTQISIIHGKGTGVLRAGIHDMLKSHRQVKSYRLGKFGEGESGVTIIELK
ncbi:MAG: endonuclease MutS2 [Oscillospiraceae bacterium]|nr:endonuclease MutS2 [Oscillospiraceae bacterium]